MKEMTLQEVQKVSLDILKDVHEFCESHNIRYSLAYGTLLGAIRHKGFIPWDDDVDIVIPRPDFERFCREYKSLCGYKLYAPDNSSSFLTYARVCNNEHTQVKTACPWTKTPTGLWIDIFPLDGLPSDETVFLKIVKDIRGIQKKVDGLRSGRYHRLSNSISVRNFIATLFRRCLYYKYDINELLCQHVNLIKKDKYESADYCGQLSVMDYPEKEHNPKEDFAFFIKVPFENSEFYVMSGYDNVLKRYYGNYMQLPPKAQQVPPQFSYIKFYWKD